MKYKHAIIILEEVLKHKRNRLRELEKEKQLGKLAKEHIGLQIKSLENAIKTLKIS